MNEEVNIDDILVLLRNTDYGPEALKELIDAIEAKLDAPGNFKADVSALATAAALTVHHAVVSAYILNIVNKSSTPHIQTYPKLATSVTVSTGVAAWAEGSWTEIIPANTITEPFWLLGIYWTPTTYDGIMEIGTGASGSEVEIANIPSFSHYTTSHGYAFLQPISLLKHIKIPANTRVAARVADTHTALTAHGLKLLYATGL